MRKIQWIFLLNIGLLMQSCAVYNKHFDCQPPRGSCCSVSEIESMIVEKEEGPDLFIPTAKESDKSYSNDSKIKDLINKENMDLEKLTNDYSCYTNERGETIFKKNESVKRVWVHGYVTPAGSYVEGRYVYFTLDDNDWVVINDVK